jgi:glycosyltransferase involved in cell wall biosynthesis
LERNIDLVHFHTPNAAFWGRLGLRGEIASGRCKLVYTAHGFHFHKNGRALTNFLFERAERLAGTCTHALLTINAEDAERAQEFKLAPGGFHCLLPGAGVDMDRFNPERLDSFHCHSILAASLGLGSHARFILMVAEFSRGKRHRDAVDALARLNQPDTHLLLAGIGAEEQGIRKLTGQLGLENHVHFLGYRRDIPELLAGSDVVILPSEREGLPVGVIEAMAMEKPVVVADARGSRDLVEGGCGWVHPIGDCAILALLLGRVFANAGEAAVRGLKAREKVLAHYGWPRVKQKLIDIYERLGISTGVAATFRSEQSVTAH